MIKTSIENFNIPVLDFDRAHLFYSNLLGYKSEIMEFEGVKLEVFKSDMENDGVGGPLIYDEQLKPSQDGTIVYLHTGKDLQTSLVKSKTKIQLFWCLKPLWVFIWDFLPYSLIPKGVY